MDHEYSQLKIWRCAMNDAFGDIRTFPASDRAKKQMKELVSKGLFHEQGDVWRVGAALGIVQKQDETKGKRETFQNINSLDPEGIFAAIMMGLFPDLAPEDVLQQACFLPYKRQH